MWWQQEVRKNAHIFCSAVQFLSRLKDLSASSKSITFYDAERDEWKLKKTMFDHENWLQV